VLSGPEPQRSFLENKLLEQAIALPCRCIVVRGKTNTKEHYFASEQIEVVSYLTGRDLNEVLLTSKVVVCRSGYSSIMDLAVLGKKALLIPTPGQTEQEYLAYFLADQGYFLVQDQEKIDLEAALKQIGATKGLQINLTREHLKNICRPGLINFSKISITPTIILSGQGDSTNLKLYPH